MKAIEVKALSKSFAVKKKQAGLWGSVKALVTPELGAKTAVHPIDFAVEEGEVLAFLGPNGAGKSTTIKMLTGILHPTSGAAAVLGLTPWQQRKRLSYRIGSVFGQKSQLWYHLPPADSFELVSRIYELDRGDYRRRLGDLVERFDIGAHMQTPVRKLSLGERMRCEIAAALLHRPRIVFLDEPTIGLDVVVKQRIRELIREMNREEGTTLFLTSHDAGDVEQLCRRVIVINHGQIILDDTVSRMKSEYLTRKTIRLKLRDGSKPYETVKLPGVTAGGPPPGGDAISLVVDTAAIGIEDVIGTLVRECRLDDITIEDPPMEDIITRIYAKAGKEEAT